MKSKTPLILAFQGSYTATQVALYQGKKCLQMLQTSGVSSSSQLILLVQQLLKVCQLELADLDFLAVNTGPGAFISLRVVVVTVNALAFASRLPIMPVCGMEALWHKAQALMPQIKDQVAVGLLNAFSGQLFVKFWEPDAPSSALVECLTVEQLLKRFAQDYQGQKIWLCGNVLPTQLLEKSTQLVLEPQLQNLEPDANDIALLALKQFEADKVMVNKAIPNYVKAGFVTASNS